jgi:hypothetical protein
MNIFRYWAWADSEATDRTGQPYFFTIRRGSDLSFEDALQRAQQAAAQLEARIAAGDEPPSWYEYSARQIPEPIIEEFRGDSGQRRGVITINRFGCEVLNTQTLAFLDIDLVPARSRRSRGGLRSRLFGGGKYEGSAAASTEVAVEGAISQLRSWVQRNPQAAVRVYRTSAGLRYLFASPAMQPGDALHEPVYEELGCDPLYRRMCVAQNCFRARLTAKPWRIGVKRSPPWRVDLIEAESSVYDRWHADYLKAAGNFAACAYLDTVGEQTETDAMTERLISLHDERSGAASGLPLA